MSLASAEPLRSYFREIAATPLLAADEERALALRVEDGDHEARDLMARANLRLVVNIARGYLGRGLPLADLISEGNVGLMRAVEGFDPGAGTRFSTYASFWIKQSIRRALMGEGCPVRLPAYMVSMLSKWRRASAVLAEKLGRAPTDAEVGKALRLSKKGLAVVARALEVKALSRAFEAGVDGDGDMMEDALADGRVRPCDEVLDEADCLERVYSRLGRLDDREATVIRARFGLDGRASRNFREIGEGLRLSRQRVQQIEALALAKLIDGVAGNGAGE